MEEYYPNLPTISSGRDTPIPPDDQLPNTIVEIGKIHFEGNIVPHEWYNHIRTPSGRTDLTAIIILAEIVYWYRPVQTLDEESGQKVILRKKFKGDMFNSPLKYYENKFGLTHDQVRQALKRLEDNGLIIREYRDVIQRGIKMINTTFVMPVPERIREITFPQSMVSPKEESSGGMLEPENTVSVPQGEVSVPQGEVSVPQGEVSVPQGEVSVPQGEVSVPLYRDYYKTTTKISTKTTTTGTPTTTDNTPAHGDEKNSSSSNLIFDFNLAGFSQTERERATQILSDLDSEIAQQILDELNSTLENESVKKSPLAWLKCVAQRAREGEFTPTSDIPKRRQAQARATAATKPPRAPSYVWKEHCKELQDAVVPGDYSTFIAPLRGTESDNTLWLEAPNALVADWAQTHMPVIEQVLRPHTPLGIRVCVG